MGKLKWIFTITGLAILLLSTTFSLLLFFIIINKGIIIDQNNVDWFDMLIKSSFTLLGSTLSGFIAVLVFYLNYLREKRNEDKRSRKMLTLITKELNRQKAILTKISSTINSASSDDISNSLLEADSEVLGLFIITYTKIANDTFDSNIQELSGEDYLSVIEQLTLIRSCQTTLKLITNGIKSHSNLIFLIGQFKTELINLESLPKLP